MIDVECPSCGRIVALADQAVGSVRTCPCGQRFRVPGGPRLGLPVSDYTTHAPRGQGGCAAVFIEIVFTIGTGGFLGGLGRLVAGKGPNSLVVSLVCCFFLSVLTASTFGLGLILWIPFVTIKLIFDVVTSA